MKFSPHWTIFMVKKKYFFEQDGAPSHRAKKKTVNWITSQNVQIIEDWPANSPDLTCIEQVWAILENRIQKYSINSLNNLYEALQKEWFSIPTEKLNGLINQTPDRFKLCIQENGKSIGYKLHTLNKKEQINFQNILNIDQNNDLMWNNLEMFFGNNSEVVRCANIIKNDIELAWTSSSD